MEVGRPLYAIGIKDKPFELVQAIKREEIVKNILQ